MSLSREVCEKCINKHRTSYNYSYFGEKSWSWFEEDSERWVDGKVFCGYPSMMSLDDFLGLQNTDDEPPEGCPYVVEHLVMQDAE